MARELSLLDGFGFARDCKRTDLSSAMSINVVRAGLPRVVAQRFQIGGRAAYLADQCPGLQIGVVCTHPQTDFLFKLGWSCGENRSGEPIQALSFPP